MKEDNRVLRQAG